MDPFVFDAYRSPFAEPLGSLEESSFTLLIEDGEDHTAIESFLSSTAVNAQSSQAAPDSLTVFALFIQRTQPQGTVGKTNAKSFQSFFALDASLFQVVKSLGDFLQASFIAVQDLRE